MSPLINEGTDLALRSGTASGKTLIQASPLTRLNYFDGKFLRAEDFRREQEYLRQLVQFSNQGLGAGVVYGMDAVLPRQGRITIGSGLAMDSSGRTLLISETASFEINALIDATRRIAKPRPNGLRGSTEFGDCIDATEPPGEAIPEGRSLYLICAGHAESLCGIEDVYGRLCEEACVTAVDRPLIVEGVVIRAIPLLLRTPLSTSRSVVLDRRHLRSLVASAYFEDERHIVKSLVSRAGLLTDTWCLGADMTAVGCVPLAVVSVAGSRTIFLDAWTVRRERMDAPARRYWAWRMGMRPWDVYLAHILQFQCHLHEVLGGQEEPGGDDDKCRDQADVLADADRYLAGVEKDYRSQIDELMRSAGPDSPAFRAAPGIQPQGGLASLTSLRARVGASLRRSFTSPRERILINGGMVELPSAGYLPVIEGGTVSVNTQVRRLLGEGVDLRFCVVRPDFVQHALEEAQHMERISLLIGLDDPSARPEVDILVPDGQIDSVSRVDTTGWDSTVSLNVGDRPADGSPAERTTVELRGAGRSEVLRGGGAAFYFAGAQEVKDPNLFTRFVRDIATLNTATLANRERVLRRLPVTEAFAPADRTASRIAANLVSRVTLSSGRTAPAAGEEALPVAAGWVSMQIQSDPFTLQVAETTPVSLDSALSMLRGDKRVLFRTQINGTLRLTQAPVAGMQERRLKGRISGLKRIRTEVGESEVANESTLLESDVDLTMTGDASTGTLTATLISAERKRFGYRFDVKWGGNPQQATVMVTGGIIRDGIFEPVGGSVPPALASANLVRSENALAAGGELRTLSTNAVEALGREIGELEGAGFADTAMRALFPPPPPPSADLTVRATRDWVLFHRRRTKRCAADVERPAPPRVRKYQVYHYRLRRAADLNAIRDALRTDAGIARLNFDRVGIIEFQAGQAALLSEILADWQAVSPGNLLAYGMIATAGEEDSTTVESARLTRLAGAVAGMSPSDSSTQLEALPNVPAALRVAGVDGVAFLVTRQLVKQECQRVFGVSDMSVWKRIWSVIMPPQATAESIDANVAMWLREKRLVELGRPRFDSSTGDPIDAAQLPGIGTGWDATPLLQGRMVVHRALWIPRNDESAQRHEVESAKSAADIASSPQMTTETVSVATAPADVPLGEADAAKRCPVMTFLVAGGLSTFAIRFVVADRTRDAAGAPHHTAMARTRQPVWRFDEHGNAPIADFGADVAPDLAAVGRKFASIELVTRADPQSAEVRRRMELVMRALSQANLLEGHARTFALKIEAVDEHFLTDEMPAANEVVFVGWE